MCIRKPADAESSSQGFRFDLQSSAGISPRQCGRVGNPPAVTCVWLSRNYGNLCMTFQELWTPTAPVRKQHEVSTNWGKNWGCNFTFFHIIHFYSPLPASVVLLFPLKELLVKSILRNPTYFRGVMVTLMGSYGHKDFFTCKFILILFLYINIKICLFGRCLLTYLFQSSWMTEEFRPRIAQSKNV